MKKEIILSNIVMELINEIQNNFSQRAFAGVPTYYLQNTYNCSTSCYGSCDYDCSGSCSSSCAGSCSDSCDGSCSGCSSDGSW